MGWHIQSKGWRVLVFLQSLNETLSRSRTSCFSLREKLRMRAPRALQNRVFPAKERQNVETSEKNPLHLLSSSCHVRGCRSWSPYSQFLTWAETWGSRPWESLVKTLQNRVFSCFLTASQRLLRTIRIKDVSEYLTDTCMIIVHHHEPFSTCTLIRPSHVETHLVTSTIVQCTFINIWKKLFQKTIEFSTSHSNNNDTLGSKINKFKEISKNRIKKYL